MSEALSLINEKIDRLDKQLSNYFMGFVTGTGKVYRLDDTVIFPRKAGHSLGFDFGGDSTGSLIASFDTQNRLKELVYSGPVDYYHAIYKMTRDTGNDPRYIVGGEELGLRDSRRRAIDDCVINRLNLLDQIFMPAEVV